MRFLSTFLAATLVSGLAVAKQPERRLVDEDRYLYAQPQATPAPDAWPRTRPAFESPSERDDNWRSGANGS